VARSRALGPAVALVVLATTSGCGLAWSNQALAHPAAQQPADAVAPTASAPSPPPDQPKVIAAGALLTRGKQVGTVQVAAEHVLTGLVPPFREFTLQCPVSGPSLQYVAVDLSFDLAEGEGGPAGHLTVSAGPATPADIGDLGVFFEQAPDDDQPYCADYPPLPTTDTFWARGTLHVTGYVVLDRAVGPATPKGRADVFPTLQLRLDHLRTRTSEGGETPLTLGPLTAGAACPDDDGAFCVPLG
jgi:hypothetical protein